MDRVHRGGPWTPCLHTSKESCVGLKLHLASIMAEIEPYSFERMRDSSGVRERRCSLESR